MKDSKVTVRQLREMLSVYPQNEEISFYPLTLHRLQANAAKTVSFCWNEDRHHIFEGISKVCISYPSSSDDRQALEMIADYLRWNGYTVTKKEYPHSE